MKNKPLRTERSEVCVNEGFCLKAGAVFSQNENQEEESEKEEPANRKALRCDHRAHRALLLQCLYIIQEKNRENQHENVVEIQTKRCQAGHGEDREIPGSDGGIHMDSCSKTVRTEENKTTADEQEGANSLKSNMSSAFGMNMKQLVDPIPERCTFLLQKDIGKVQKSGSNDVFQKTAVPETDNKPHEKHGKIHGDFFALLASKSADGFLTKAVEQI